LEQDTQRGREILEAALALVAEKGIAGASLRKLADKVGLSQPSLYHYFKTKDELIDQLAQVGADHMVQSMDLSVLPHCAPEDLPHYFKERIFELWTGERHLRYAKFLFVLAIESPRHRPVIQRVFEQKLLGDPPAEIAGYFAQDPEFAQRLVEGLVMMARAIGFSLVEERILFGLAEPSEKARRHGDFVADAVRALLLAPRKGQKANQP
jgi:AcrR family transcriptional regulator